MQAAVKRELVFIAVQTSRQEDVFLTKKFPQRVSKDCATVPAKPFRATCGARDPLLGAHTKVAH